SRPAPARVRRPAIPARLAAPPREPRQEARRSSQPPHGRAPTAATPLVQSFSSRDLDSALSAPAAAGAHAAAARAGARTVAARRAAAAAAAGARAAVVAHARGAFGPRGLIAIQLADSVRGRGRAPGRARRRRRAVARSRPLGRAPRSAVVLLPAAILAPVDVAVAPGVHVAAAGSHHAAAALRPGARDRRTAAAAARRARRRAGGAVGDACRLRPLIAALHRGRPPAPVHARTLLRASVCTGAWVVGGGRSARAPGSPRDGAAGIHTRGRVVARADTGAAVRPVHRCAPAVAAGPRVVPGAVSVGGIEGIV